MKYHDDSNPESYVSVIQIKELEVDKFSDREREAFIIPSVKKTRFISNRSCPLQSDHAIQKLH